MASPAKMVRTTAAGVTTGYTVLLFAAGVDVSEDLRRLVAFLPAVAVGLLLAFDLRLWRLWKVRDWSGRPYVAGTWETIITPHPDSHIPDGGKRGPFTAATIIEQTYWTLSVVQLSDESDSHSRAAGMVPLNAENRTRKVLHTTYENIPHVDVRQRSPQHYGGARLTVVGDAPSTMTGTYWTDRFTAGSLDLRLLARETSYATVEDALAGQKRPGSIARVRAHLRRKNGPPIDGIAGRPGDPDTR